MSDAQALLRVGALDRAAAMVQGGGSLGHALLLAQVKRARGDYTGALTCLRSAIDEASEDVPSYLGALVEMAELSAATGKKRGAKRLLDEVEDINPSHESARVALVRRGLALLH
ncbi:MAG TPA: hypothetical protein DFR83_19295 [Deltaproteobacteria bacterium]|nr:hypothetical protein [Deltaproteobacteria bacterium]